MVTMVLKVRAETDFDRVRCRLVGLPYMQGNKEYLAKPPASPEEWAAQLKRIDPIQWALVGYGIPIVLSLMIFEPF
jgi:hypothetical protein